ncbi:MAG: RadC family protein [Planctomycetia bacterium]
MRPTASSSASPALPGAAPAAPARPRDRDGPAIPTACPLASRMDLHGPESLEPLDLLLLALGRAHHARAGVARVLERAGGPRRLCEAGPGELARSTGLTLAAARRLVAGLALGRRLACTPLVAGEPLCSTAQVAEAYSPRLTARAREHFVVLLLDARNRVLREEQVSVGTLTASLVHPREVFAAAIREGAASILLLHNHPSGDPEPSADDEAVTRRLVAVGELVGIPVLDHLVLGRGRFVSLLERGLVPPVRVPAPS